MGLGLMVRGEARNPNPQIPQVGTSNVVALAEGL